MNDRKKNSLLAYLGGMALVGVMLLAVYILKGIAPFGTATIDYFDGSQLGLPNLYQWWDILHRRTSWFFDWYECLGTGILPVYMPDYLLMALLPRLYVRAFPAVMLGLRLVGSCFVMQFVLDKTVPALSPWVRAALGVMYACCGFMLRFNYMIIWMDFVLIFPLVMLGMEQLLRKGKRFWLVVSLTAMFILNVYMAGFVLLFVLICGGIEVFAAVQPAEQGRAAWNLALCVVQSVLLSAVAMLPMAFIMLLSDRAGLVGGSAGGMVSGYLQTCLQAVQDTALTADKTNILYGLWVPLCWLLVRLWKRLRGGDRAAMARFLCMVCMLLPIANEAVNLAWHFGSYNLFSMRYGFILSGMVVFYLAQELAEPAAKKPIKNALPMAAVCAPALAALTVMLVRTADRMSLGGADQAAAKLRLGLLLLNTAFVLLGVCLLMALKKKKAVLWVGVLLLAVHSGTALYAYVAPENRVGDYTQMPQFVADAALLNEQMGPSTDMLSRVKNGDTSLNNNYPLVLGYPALSGWNDGVWYDTVDGGFRRLIISMGYADCFTRVLDQGGTLFSDAFIGVRQQLVSYETAVDGANYALTRELGGYHLYDCAFQLPAGLAVNGEKAAEFAPQADIVDTQNALWQLLTESDTQLLTREDADWTADENGQRHTELHLDGEKEVYFCYTAPGGTQVDVYRNGEIVTVPYYQRPYNKAYPDDFCNGLLDLGAFAEGDSVVIAVSPRDEKTLTAEDVADFQLVTLDRAMLAEFCAAAQGAEYTVAGRHMRWHKADAHAGELLILPVQYADGWRAVVNGKKVKPVKFGGGLLAVPLGEGTCDITMSFFPKGFLPGAVLTLAGILLTAALLLLARTKAYAAMEKALGAVARPLLALAAAAAVLVVYLIPLACTLAGMIIG